MAAPPTRKSHTALPLIVLLLFCPAQTHAGQQEVTASQRAKLQAKDPLVRIEAILDIYRANILGTTTATLLADRILADDNSYVREIASDVLSNMRASAKNLAPRFVRILEDSNLSATRRARAAQVLGAIGGEAPKSLGPLVNVLENKKQTELLREAAADAILLFGGLPGVTVPRIEKVAFDPAEGLPLRKKAMRTLANTGGEAASTIPRFSSILADRGIGLDLRKQAAYSLGAIGAGAQDASAAGALTKVLEDEGENPELRMAAGLALQKIGRIASEAAPVLRQIAASRQRNIPTELRVVSIEVLRGLAQSTQIFCGDLSKIARSPDDDIRVRVKAAQALASCRPAPTDLTTMVDLAQDLQAPPELRLAAIGVVRPEDATRLGLANKLTLIVADEGQDPSVRTRTASILAQARPVPPRFVQELARVLGDPTADSELRLGFAAAASTSGAEAADAVPALVGIIRNSNDLTLRRQACWALRGIGRNGIGFLHTMQAVLHNGGEDLQIRRAAVDALGATAAADKSIVPSVVPILRDVLERSTDLGMRESAALHLGLIGAGETTDVSLLSQIFMDTREDPELRTRAVWALGRIGGERVEAENLSMMLRVVEDEQEQPGLRQGVASALATIQPPARAAITTLIRVTQKSRDQSVRTAAANALGSLGDGSEEVARALASVLSDEREENALREAAAKSLGSTGAAAEPYIGSFLEALRGEQRVPFDAVLGLLSYSSWAGAHGDTRELAVLRKAADLMAARSDLSNITDDNGEKYLARLKRNIASIQAEASAQRWRAVNDMREAYPITFYVLLLLIFWYTFLGAILWLNPIWLVGIGEKVIDIEQWVNLRLLKGVQIRVGFLLLPPFFRFRTRSLDAWVRQKAPAIKASFADLPTVKERLVYVDLPVQINSSVAEHFGPQSLKDAFNEVRALVLVTGEGGAGKTSIACQIGLWAVAQDRSERITDHQMLPLLFEGDIAFAGNPTPFPEVVRTQLGVLLREEPPSEELVQRLLKEKRILVCVDGLSEMSEASQAAISPVDPTILARALLITARREMPISAVRPVKVEPRRLERSSLSDFVDRYLKKIAKSHLLTLQEFQEELGSLQGMVGDKGVTPLFARLYIELLVSHKEGANGIDLPQSVPELILQYTNHLNRKIVSGKKPDDRVHELAQAVAMQCVLPNLRPSPANIDKVLRALGEGPDADENRKYLEERVGLIQTLEPGREVRFRMDPIAEHFAAMGLVRENQDERARWSDFYGRVDRATGGAAAVSGFLESVLAWREYERKRLGLADGRVDDEIRGRLSAN